MAFQHFLNKNNLPEKKEMSVAAREGIILRELTKHNGFSIIKHIIEELKREYEEKVVIEKDYAPMYGKESLKKLLEIIDERIAVSNSYLDEQVS